MSHFDVYGKMAQKNVADACQNGRYAIQGDAEANVPVDMMAKLNIQATDHFLDIGCGLGLNIQPIAKIVKRSVGCDHPDVIKKARQKINDPQVELIGENFLDLEFKEQFDKILAYSVLPALPDNEVLFKFVDKALELLKPSGRMILGDLSNHDKKTRFVNSARGEKFLEDWNKNYTSQSDDENLSCFADAGNAVAFDDDLVLDVVKHIRKKGFHAYLLDQPQDLPFGNSREDILVVGPEYSDGT